MLVIRQLVKHTKTREFVGFDKSDEMIGKMKDREYYMAKGIFIYV